MPHYRCAHWKMYLQMAVRGTARWAIRSDLGVTLFVENWLALNEKWLKIDLSRLGVNKMTWLDLEQKQLKNWLDLKQKQYMHTFTLQLNQDHGPSKGKHKSTKLAIDFACSFIKNSSQRCLSGWIKSTLMWRTDKTGERSASQLSTQHWYQFYH